MAVFPIARNIEGRTFGIFAGDVQDIRLLVWCLPALIASISGFWILAAQGSRAAYVFVFSGVASMAVWMWVLATLNAKSIGLSLGGYGMALAALASMVGIFLWLRRMRPRLRKASSH